MRLASSPCCTAPPDNDTSSGMVVEYDQELLAPIGVVRDREQLRGRDVLVIEGGGAVMLVPKEGGSADPRCVLPYHARYVLLGR